MSTDGSITFLGASVVASFLGGMLAFIAPCCVSFLFPSYFATAFKTKKRIFLMTFIYFLGLAVVLVPIGLGVSALAQLFSQYHETVFFSGGLLMIFLAFLTLFGKTIPLPFKVRAEFGKGDVVSIFLLGLASGAASSCCTPVLIGVLTITALSGTFFYAILLSLTYVLGMVFPLFLLSYFWDKYKFSEFKWLKGKLFSWRVFNKEYYIHSSHLISAVILGIMGLLIIILSLTGKTWTSTKYMLAISNTFGKMNTAIINRAKFLPEYIWVVLIIILLILVVWLAFKPKENK